MTRKLFAAALVAALSSTSLVPTQFASADTTTITIEQPWARATPGALSTGAVYLTVIDHGGADRLIGISTPVAGMAMMHESFDEGGISKMRMLDSVPLDPNKPVIFHPGALHIMLEGLKSPLKVGSSFPLTLTFEKAPPQTVTVTVLKAGAPGPVQEMPGMKMQ